MIMDRLYHRVGEVGPVCVGLDTKVEYIPEFMRAQTADLSEQIFLFNRSIIDATKDVAAVFKVQIAFYEAYGLAGMKAYMRTVRYLKEKDCLVIGDVKRGDISSTAQMYAKAHFEGDFAVDFVTLNPYMGFDTLDAYRPYLKSGKHGVFVLVRTSNPGAADLQGLPMEDGAALYTHVADGLQTIAQEYIGASGYSALGVVFGGTQKDAVEKIRARYSDLFFLIPGYGAQGGTGADVRRYLKDGNGGVVNSSRGIITAFRDVEDSEEAVQRCAYEACIQMREELGFGE
ncbi:MAG: orotidine-5'-phosphate decarboxylase [Peptoniphilaceae bacterium]|jgi:orotidine-5'-phosphate decarboxylase|nr:orotidine-5'-phosphate decarboxylase [Bacillota bacterium]